MSLLCARPCHCYPRNPVSVQGAAASAQHLLQLGRDIASADGEVTAAENEALQAVAGGLGISV
ncbi:MAG: TerB family tellurite resistance protein [Pseudomonadota bacterium]